MSYFDQITKPILIQSYAVLFFVSLAFCVVIVLSSSHGFTRRAALDEAAVQSAHQGFVPRVGGLAIYLSILGLIPILTLGFVPISLVFDFKTGEIVLLILTAAPVFFVGIMEDFGYPMTPIKRLTASIMSGILALILFEVWLTKIGIPGIDYLLYFAPVGILFTIFATVGVVNAFNLIDGLNGLSSYISISTAIALSIVAFKIDNTQITIFLVLLTAPVFGFLVVNFPFGKIFLGDGGAYTLGHLLVWSAIVLTVENPSISSFSILLIFFWPVADTGLAIWRRWRLGNPADRPDRLHFHHLVMRFIEIRFFGREKRKFTNPFATFILVPLISTPQVLGVFFWDDLVATVWITIGMGTLFIITYLLGISLTKKRFLSNE